MFEISTLEFVKTQCFLQKKKFLISDMLYLDILDGKTSVICTLELGQTYLMECIYLLKYVD